MPVNPFFTNYGFKPSQDLMEDLMIESIKIKGLEVYYIPRRYVEVDDLFGEDPNSHFNVSFPIEVYLESFNGFEGERELVTKFGIEIRDNLTLTVAKKRFEQEAAKLQSLSDRPIELDAPSMGDLIYFPLSKGLFEIKYVDNKQVFFQGDKLYTYKLECELFKYSMETVETGNTEIDGITENLLTEVVDADGNYVVDDKTKNDNQLLDTEGLNIVDYSEIDPFSEGNY